jgi:hypothetical protein
MDWKHDNAYTTEGTDAAVARRIGLSLNNFARYKRRRLRHERGAAEVLVVGDTTRAAGSGNLPPAAMPSFGIAVDLWEAIQAFAASYHLQGKDALDCLVRKALAAHSEGVGADA